MTEISVTEAEAYARRHAEWNFRVSVIDTIFIMAGLSIVSRDTVMPVLVANLTDSKFAIGLIATLFNLGMYLPQLLIANFSERLRYKLPYLLWLSGIFERGAYLAMAFVIWWFAASSPTLTLVLFFILLAITAFSIGLGVPAWYDMIAKVIAVERRGRYSGIGHALGALVGVPCAWFLVGNLLENFAFPNNFALIFLIAFGVMWLSWIALYLTREPPSAMTKQAVPTITYLRQLPTILRRDHNYTRYVFSCAAIKLGTMAGGFYIGYGIERFHLSAGDVGIYTSVLIASQAVASLAWGFIADRTGYKTVIGIAAFALALAPFCAFFAPSQAWLMLVFVLLGVYSGADYVAALNIILEFCPPEDRPTYIGLTNTLFAPVLTLGPLAGGWLAGVVGYQGLFMVALSAALVGGVLMIAWVREPRQHVG